MPNGHGGYVRYFSVRPKRMDTIQTIEFVKEPDETAPMTLAVTAELPAVYNGRPLQTTLATPAKEIDVLKSIDLQKR